MSRLTRRIALLTSRTGGGVASLPVTLPVAPILFAGTGRLSNWSGNSALARNSALATQNIGFVSDRYNLAASDTFGGGANSDVRLNKIYDQSGNGFDLLQTLGSGAEAKISRSQLAGAALPITFGPNLVYPIPSGVSVDRANHTVFLVINPHLSKANYYWLSLGGTTLRFGTPQPDISPNGGVRLFDTTNSVSKFSTKPPRFGPQVIGYSSGATGVKIYCDGTLETIAGALASATLTGGNLENGNGYSEIFSVAIFNRAMTDQEMTDTAKALEAVIAVRPPSPTKGVLLTGDSIRAGQGSQAIYTAGLGMTASEPQQIYNLLGASPDIAMFNLGQPSIAASQWYSSRAVIAALMAAYPTITKWVHAEQAGVNDLRAGATDTAVYNSKTNLSSYMRGLGAKSIVSTINTQTISGPYTALSETYRVSANASLNTNWASVADDIVDYAAITQLQNPADTTYFAADGLHQTALAYQLKAALLAPKIAALLAA